MMVEMIHYMLKRGGVWFATLGEINDHVKKLVAEDLWKPRIDAVPYDPQPISEIDHLRKR